MHRSKSRQPLLQVSASTTWAASRTGPTVVAKSRNERLKKRSARSSRPRIERVAKPIADQIERKHGQEDGEPWPDRHPWRVDEKPLRGIEHAAPCGRRGLLAKAEKRQCGFRNDSRRDR